MPYRVGIDTGGTFTDIVLVDDITGEIATAKVESTPSDPGLAALKGLRDLGKPPESIASIALGTTITTNAVLQRKGARVLYITTKGFEDIPYLQRADKPDPYDLQWERPRPLVRRRDCIGVLERIGSDGSVLQRLASSELDRIEKLVETWIADDSLATDESPAPGGGHQDRAIAINLLFSYANSVHERKLAAHLAKKFPSLAISLSSEVSPLWREYERASTTILDAFTRPLLKRFLQSLQERLRADGYRAHLAVMKSNGGRMLAEAAVDRPIQILLSGLAGGVVGGDVFGEVTGRRNVITFDMGGTSTDVAVIVDGLLTYTTEYQLEFGLPVSIPSLDVITIGAGGGSIAWVDKGGLLKVGPRSAGADPGPVCYGRGGVEPTVTDANLALGRLGSRSLLGGGMALDEGASLATFETLGAKLGLSVEQAARAVIAVANENMANSIRVLTIQRGLDPRDFAVVAFGGAGPLHAAEIADILGVPDVIIPPNPGLTSALGTLIATPKVDAQRTYVRQGADINSRELHAVLLDLQKSAKADLVTEGHKGEPEVRSSISMRYAGQSHEQDVPVVGSPDRPNWLNDLFEEFHRQHEKSYGYRIEAEAIEVTACSVSVSGIGVSLPKGGGAKMSRSFRASARRLVDVGRTDKVDCPVLDRAALTVGQEIPGPAIVEGYDSAALILPGFKAVVHPSGALSMRGEQEVRTVRGTKEPATLSIINNALVNICREMGTTMMRTAYSPIFNESRDFSCAIFDRNGQMLAQGEYCPAQLGAIVCTVETLIKEFGSTRIAPGDVIIHNDPYRGGCHMPEHLLLKPIYHNGELMAYAAIIAHFAEIGGMVVGSFAATATEVFQEGLRLPPVRLMRGGERVQEVWDIMLANHRTPRNTWGDLHAMLAALRVAEGRFVALCDKFGAHFISEVSVALLDYAERWMRYEIRNIPDGVYDFDDHMEDDGVGDRPIQMHVSVTVSGDEITADFSNSDPQARGPINATRGVTMSATYNALYQLADKAIPKNAGCYRPIHVVTKRGTCLDVQYPGPSVGGNTETQPKIVFMILGALAKMIPDRVSACEGCTACNFLIGGLHPKTGEYYAHYHFEASGWGGRATKDGNDCQNHIHGNCRITPVEVFETRFPIRVLSYGLRTDSGGAGRFRGGLASYRTMRVEASELRVSMLMDHTKTGPWPVNGGSSGSLAGIAVKKAGEKRFRSFSEVFGTASPSKFADVSLHEGDEVRIESCGGAGYGNPLERSRELVERDVAEGFVSAASAARIYGAQQNRRARNFGNPKARSR